MLKLYILLFVIVILIILLNKKKTLENFKNLELFFIHIPKNAGTTIENIFHKNNIDVGRFYFKKKKIKNVPCSRWHTLPSNKNIKNHYDNKINFCIVRNPYERIISEYTYLQKRYNKNKNLSKKELNNFIKRSIEKYKKNSNCYDCHLKPQVEYIYGTPKCNEILRLENLDSDLKKLLKKYNYPKIKLQNSNTSNSKRFNVKDLDKDSIKLINKTYKDDFEKLKYNMINP